MADNENNTKADNANSITNLVITTVMGGLRSYLKDKTNLSPERKREIAENLKSSTSVTDVLSVARREMGDQALGDLMKPLLPEIRRGFYRPVSFSDPGLKPPTLEESRGESAVELAEAYSYLTGAPIADLREVASGRRLDPERGDKPSGVPIEVPKGSALDFTQGSGARYSPYTSSGRLPEGTPAISGIGYDDASRDSNMGPGRYFGVEPNEYEYGPGYAIRMGEMHTNSGRDVPQDVRALYGQLARDTYYYDRQKRREGAMGAMTGLSSVLFPVATAAALAAKPVVMGEAQGIDSIGDTALASALAASKIPAANNFRKMLGLGAAAAGGGAAAYAYNRDEIDRTIDTIRRIQPTVSNATSGAELASDLSSIRQVINNPRAFVRRHGREATVQMLDSVPKESQRQVAKALGLDPEKPLSSYIPQRELDTADSSPKPKVAPPDLQQDLVDEASYVAGQHQPLIARLGGTALRALPLPGAAPLGTALRTGGYGKVHKASNDPNFDTKGRKALGENDRLRTGMRRARIAGSVLPDTTSGPSTIKDELIDPVSRTARTVSDIVRRHRSTPTASSTPSTPDTPSTPSASRTPDTPSTPSASGPELRKASAYIGITKQLLSSEGMRRFSVVAAV